jgi:hypothetical protein
MIFLTGCPRVTRVETTINPCLVKPPPQPPALKREPCQFEVCYDAENAGKLAGWVYEMWGWAEEAWQTCGEKK